MGEYISYSLKLVTLRVVGNVFGLYCHRLHFQCIINQRIDWQHMILIHSTLFCTLDVLNDGIILTVTKDQNTVNYI